MVSSRIRNLVGYAVALAILAVGAVWVARNWESVSAAFSLNPIYLLVLFPIAVANGLYVGLLNQVVGAHLGAWLNFRRWASLGFASTLMNHFLPSLSGMALRATYYKQVEGMPFARFASAMAVIHVINALMNALAAMVVLVWMRSSTGVMSWPAFIVMAAVALCSILLLTLSPKPSGPPAESGFRAIWGTVHHGWEELRSSPRLLAKVAGIVIGGIGLNATRLFVVYLALGHPLSFAGCVLVGVVTQLGTVLSFTPGALGIRDGAIVLGSIAVGVGAETSVLASVLDRAVLLVVVLIIGPFAALKVSREIARGEAG